MQLSINAGTSDNKAKNHAHDKSNLKMQELKENGINIDEFIHIIRVYERQVEIEWLKFEKLLNQSQDE